MYYGIDLGTTNSLIGSGDTLYSGLVSSSVNVETGKQSPRDVVGENIVSSYKTDMTIGNEGQLPIKCSSIILKELCEQASRRANEDVKDVVVSVPAKFTHTQRQAVWQAAEMAGLNMRGLINEPTAAAIYTCKDVKDLIIVYDLGGGTFDVTLIDSRAGNYYVVATDGRILAGDDFDKALVEYAYNSLKIKMRYRGRDMRRKFTALMRIAKEAYQKTALTQYIDMTEFGYDGEFELTGEIYINIMKTVFAPTITLTNYLVSSNLDNNEEPKLVFVGGSTACPFLRKWVEEETGLESVDTDTAPDLIVAKGVALYARMLYDGTAQREVEDVTKRLCIEDDKGMSLTIIEKNTTIPVTEVLTVTNQVESDKLEVRLYQGDSILCSGNDYIGTLVYNYNEVKKPQEGYVDIEVTVDRDGRISLTGVDILTLEKQTVKLVMR